MNTNSQQPIQDSSTTSKPVEYYNKYNRYNKDKRDNKYVSGISTYQVSDLNRDDICPADASGLASLSASQNTPSGHLGEPGAQVEPVVGNPAPPEMALNEDMIARAIFQLFANEGTTAKHKLKVRFNLTDKENPEFIASLTTDWGNFKKYIPEECRELVQDEVRQLRKEVKQQYGKYPLIGKFHLNTGKSGNQTKTWIQTEPFTWAVVWYSQTAEHWMGYIRFYDWTYKFDIIASDVTERQHKVGVVAQHLYINPKHNTTPRPLTWAERRKQK